MDWSLLLKGARLIRNYRTTYRPRKNDAGKLTRLWLEKLTLRAANLKADQGIIFKAHEDFIHIRASLAVENSTHKFHSKKGNCQLSNGIILQSKKMKIS
jgi:hypothetical protein